MKGEQRGREEAGSVQRPFKKQLGDTCQHFPGLQPWMSNTEELPFLDPALQKQAVKVKKMENLKKKVEWKVTEMVEWGGGHGGRDQGQHAGQGVQG